MGMTYFSEMQRTASPRTCYFVILCLVSYIALDFGLHHTGSSQCADLVFGAGQGEEDAVCASVQGHLASEPELPVARAWSQMKWIGAPAKCKVKGQVIESLDVVNNFRRGYALKFVADVEDKTLVLPWLYATKVDLNRRARRVYLDLGANAFHTSVLWFSRMYPCDFTEVHAWEVSSGLFRIPSPAFDEDTNWSPENSHATRVVATPEVPHWMAARIKLSNAYVADFDGADTVNITRVIKEELKLRKEDAVVVKMDIEGAEWPILERWANDPEMAEIIDELFVEVHYNHPSMHDFNWNTFSHSREQAHLLLATLRARRFFVHPWP